MPIDPFPWGESSFFLLPFGLGRRILPPSPHLHARPAKPPGGQARTSKQASTVGGRVPCLALPRHSQQRRLESQTKPNLLSFGPGKQASRQALWLWLCVCVFKPLCPCYHPPHTARHYTHAHTQSSHATRANKAFSSWVMGDAPSSPPLLQAAPPSFLACVHPFCSAFPGAHQEHIRRMKANAMSKKVDLPWQQPAISSHDVGSFTIKAAGTARAAKRQTLLLRTGRAPMAKATAVTIQPKKAISR
jgi:hypothetical protein